MPAQILFTQQAQADIADIIAYYRPSDAAVHQFLRNIEEATDHLEAYPETATHRRDLTKRNVLFWLVKPYWMVLKSVNNFLLVIAVVHTSRHIGRALHQRSRSPKN